MRIAPWIQGVPKCKYRTPSDSEKFKAWALGLSFRDVLRAAKLRRPWKKALQEGIAKRPCKEALQEGIAKRPYKKALV
ncbi:MAG: hypothetical protein ACKO6H_09870 [Betaproteobacteria bacterium]